MRLPVAGLAQDLSFLMTRTSEELAEDRRGPHQLLRVGVMAVGAGGQGAVVPGFIHLPGGNSLEQIPVTVRTPDVMCALAGSDFYRGVNLPVAVERPVAAGMTLITILLNV